MKDMMRYLDDDEIEDFLDGLDHDGDGFIDYDEVKTALDLVHKEIAPNAKPHNLHHDTKDADGTHRFLRSIIGSDAKRIPRREFASRVREWKIPSTRQDAEEEQSQRDYMRSLGTWGRIRSYWAVHGPEILFLVVVVAMQLAAGIYELVDFLIQPKYRAAFGWGVVIAKGCAGALYPTMFFLILSMSRYFSTFMRRWYYVSRFINWDRSQVFHIYLAIVALGLGTLHSIGHLTGTFVTGSFPQNQDAVAKVLGPDVVPLRYIDYISLLPGYTGIAALGLFWILSLLSTPKVRRWRYEVFQIGHLLIYPIILLLSAHGVSGLLQRPIMGYFLVFPTLLVVVERSIRILIGLHRIPATIEIVDSETVEIKARIPAHRIWKYHAGQYVLVQVPKISFFQWHPFTVSACVDREMRIDIQTGGNWTSKLRALASDKGPTPLYIGIDGPFGAPAQRFYDFTHTIIVGAGIGVTPFAGVLNDLQANDDKIHGGPMKYAHCDQTDSDEQIPLTGEAVELERDLNVQQHKASHATRSPSSSQVSLPGFASDYRRVDFHWIVRDRNHLLWFSDLLNEVTRSQIWHRNRNRNGDPSSHLDIRIATHVTEKQKSLATHIYRWLLEKHRTGDHPESPLTGLINPTYFGRPDLVGALDAHYEEMKTFQAAAAENDLDSGSSMAGKRFKVGVFFCGTPVVGEILADRCRRLSARGRSDGTRIEYHFMKEVFG
ncbi:FAD-binding domain-containing protein [Xylariaceae sp. FL1019]|nr:FAD-binding domain-containing protein [Xylariaceae sp. FL1019]